MVGGEAGWEICLCGGIVIYYVISHRLFSHSHSLSSAMTLTVGRSIDNSKDKIMFYTQESDRDTISIRVVTSS